MQNRENIDKYKEELLCNKICVYCPFNNNDGCDMQPYFDAKQKLDTIVKEIEQIEPWNMSSREMKEMCLDIIKSENKLKEIEK